ncbi:MAG: hypothetical protein V4725_05785 [Bacteroidota bacterium]
MIVRHNSERAIAQNITIFTSAGGLLANFSNVSRFNIRSAPAEFYYYRMRFEGNVIEGKLVKW